MPEDFLTKKELKKFIERLDVTLSYIDRNCGMTKEDEVYYSNMYYSLVNFKNFMKEEKL